MFDLDGTLVNSEEAILESALATFAKFDIADPQENEIRNSIGIPIGAIFKKYIENSSLLEESINFFRTHLAESGPKKTELFPEVITVLQAIDIEENALCVVSNKKTSLAEIVLEQQGILHYFEKVYGIDQGMPKPSPEMLEKCMSDFPEIHSLMIGDRPEDILAGKAAGALTAVVRSRFHELFKSQAESPDFHLPTLLDLPKVILTIKSKGISNEIL